MVEILPAPPPANVSSGKALKQEAKEGRRMTKWANSSSQTLDGRREVGLVDIVLARNPKPTQSVSILCILLLTSGRRCVAVLVGVENSMSDSARSRVVIT